MELSCWIELSRRAYALLLYLYPQEHRLEYGPSMLQVFTDQCRAASQAKGAWGLAALWFRTLVDLGVNALREQIASLRASWGLLEAVPNAPLPWKGVALVLVPGLIFFIAQIGQISGQPWFQLMVYRAAYFLIIPVLLVWAITHKFPIWGLITLGLFFNTGWEFGYRFQVQAVHLYNPVMSWLSDLIVRYRNAEKIAMVACLLGLMILLVWLAARRGCISRGAWAVIGMNILLVAANLAYIYLSAIQWISHQTDYSLDKGTFIASLKGHLPYDFYYNTGFLFLILLGTLLVRKYGRLTLLLPLGYLLPTILVGGLSEQTPNLFWISAAVLAYRLMIAVVAPVWIVRSASDRSQKRAGTFTLAVGIGIPVLLRIIQYHLLVSMNSISDLLLIASGNSDLLLIAAGIALALTLYKTTAPRQTKPRRAVLPAEMAES